MEDPASCNSTEQRYSREINICSAVQDNFCLLPWLQSLSFQENSNRTKGKRIKSSHSHVITLTSIFILFFHLCLVLIVVQLFKTLSVFYGDYNPYVFKTTLLGLKANESNNRYYFITRYYFKINFNIIPRSMSTFHDYNSEYITHRFIKKIQQIIIVRLIQNYDYKIAVKKGFNAPLNECIYSYIYIYPFFYYHPSWLSRGSNSMQQVNSQIMNQNLSQEPGNWLPDYVTCIKGMYEGLPNTRGISYSIKGTLIFLNSLSPKKKKRILRTR
jgi:hypothetical protein